MSRTFSFLLDMLVPTRPCVSVESRDAKCVGLAGEWYWGYAWDEALARGFGDPNGPFPGPWCVLGSRFLCAVRCNAPSVTPSPSHTLIHFERTPHPPLPPDTHTRNAQGHPDEPKECTISAPGPLSFRAPQDQHHRQQHQRGRPQFVAQQAFSTDLKNTTFTWGERSALFASVFVPLAAPIDGRGIARKLRPFKRAAAIAKAAMPLTMYGILLTPFQQPAAGPKTHARRRGGGGVTTVKEGGGGGRQNVTGIVVTAFLQRAGHSIAGRRGFGYITRELPDAVRDLRLCGGCCRCCRCCGSGADRPKERLGPLRAG